MDRLRESVGLLPQGGAWGLIHRDVPTYTAGERCTRGTVITWEHPGAQPPGDTVEEIQPPLKPGKDDWGHGADDHVPALSTQDPFYNTVHEDFSTCKPVAIRAQWGLWRTGGPEALDRSNPSPSSSQLLFCQNSSRVFKERMEITNLEGQFHSLQMQGKSTCGSQPISACRPQSCERARDLGFALCCDGRTPLPRCLNSFLPRL